MEEGSVEASTFKGEGSGMSGLKEKAKSASEIQDYTVQFFDKIRNAKNPEKAREEWMTICDKKEWVRLEDAEQEIAELKQKLQQILKRMPWQAEKQCREIEELLKEEREAKP